MKESKCFELFVKKGSPVLGSQPERDGLITLSIYIKVSTGFHSLVVIIRRPIDDVIY